MFPFYLQAIVQLFNSESRPGTSMIAITIKKVNEAYKKLIKSDVKYRFSITAVQKKRILV